MKVQVNRFFLTSLIAFLLGIINSTAQDHMVIPLNDYKEIYTSKHYVISKEVEADTNSSFDQKLSIYHSKVDKLKEEFKSKRTLEYQSKSVKRARKGTCKGTHIRRPTNCESALIKAPNENMYTIEDWVQVSSEGEKKGINVYIDSSFVSLKMSTTGMKTNKASVQTIFKYKPNLIPLIVDKETDELFNQIINKK